MTFCENQIEFSQLPIAILGGFLGGKKFGFHIHDIQSNKQKHICGKIEILSLFMCFGLCT